MRRSNGTCMCAEVPTESSEELTPSPNPECADVLAWHAQTYPPCAAPPNPRRTTWTRCRTAPRRSGLPST